MYRRRSLSLILGLTRTSAMIRKEYDENERKMIHRIVEDTEGKKRERKLSKRMAESRMASSVPSEKKSLKQITQNTLIKIDDLGFFKIIYVAGNGNCFFNALVTSQHMRISCASTLRASISDRLEDEEIEGEVKRLYYDVAKEKK